VGHVRTVLAEVAPAWLLEHIDLQWAERYEKRFSDVRVPKDENKRVELAETIGADGRQLFDWSCAESGLSWVRELDAGETLRRVWVQHSHASEQGTPWREDGERAPSAFLITSPSAGEARSSRKRSTAWNGFTVHFTETCDAHLIVEVTAPSATLADGEIVEEFHAHLADQQMLPQEHVMDAEILAHSQSRSPVDVIGPAMPDLTRSWACRSEPVPHHLASQTGGLSCWRHEPRLAPDPRSTGKPQRRVRFPLSTCRSCPVHETWTAVGAKVLRVRPDEATNTALVAARQRQETPTFWKQYATRAGIEGTVAQAVRTCDTLHWPQHAQTARFFHGHRHHCVANLHLACQRHSCPALRSAGRFGPIGGGLVQGNAPTLSSWGSTSSVVLLPFSEKNLQNVGFNAFLTRSQYTESSLDKIVRPAKLPCKMCQESSHPIFHSTPLLAVYFLRTAEKMSEL